MFEDTSDIFYDLSAFHAAGLSGEQEITTFPYSNVGAKYLLVIIVYRF
jgi:hypothetical protein